METYRGWGRDKLMETIDRQINQVESEDEVK